MINNKLLFSLTLVLATLFQQPQAFAQTGKAVYVDKQGVLRWKDSGKEASFFGVNYTTPFAYGYRATQALGVSPEEVIKQDVYHMARLGLNAFRVHVWDTEITDTAGNLIQNEHLRLFDFLLAELKKRNIQIIITPIAFWGNGYPERDEKTPGFSAKYGKSAALVKEEAIRAQENYLKQFFNHVNPYTRLRYVEDDAVIATEINNEPQHSGSKEGAKSYVNRLAASIRATGWTKPVFYNISESPWYADAVANANIDGVSFQWYPTGLVANHTLKGNFLPNVDRYHIPFDTIPAFKNKARMVYEFDAGDVMQPIMYPAMARSFRTAGFQWATQFAYDPLISAYANTEYQTHYLNLAYTPAKAISLLIANKVFHALPRFKEYGSYPANSRFSDFYLNYQQGLSEMNTHEEFYYTASTSSIPASTTKLRKVAGVGNSSVVNYSGSGAYFLDKLEEGVWRLEVMPDAILIRDPFEKASLKKEVTRLEWKAEEIRIFLPGLNTGFTYRALNEGNTLSGTAANGTFKVYPGTYLLLSPSKAGKLPSVFKGSSIALNEFFAPQSISSTIAVQHTPYTGVSEGRSFTIKANVVGVSKDAVMNLLIHQLNGEYKTIPFLAVGANEYAAEVPASFVVPGLLRYRIAIKQGRDEVVFPGNHQGDPWAWDHYHNETWQTYVAARNSALELYNASRDHALRSVPAWDKSIKTAYVTTGTGTELVYRLEVLSPPKEKVAGFRLYIGDKVVGRHTELNDFTRIRLRARKLSAQQDTLQVALIDGNAQAFTAKFALNAEWSTLDIPLSKFHKDRSILLPRPYPGFQPLWFSPSSASFQWRAIEQLEICLPDTTSTPQGFEIESVYLTN